MRTPIAVVGLGGVFPGAMTLDAFWANIVAGRDQTRDVPPGRWILPSNVALSDGPQPDRVYSLRGCFVDPFELDMSGLDVDTDLLKHLDPLYSIALEAARSAITDARIGDAHRPRTGVILAAIALPTDGSSATTRNTLGRALWNRLCEQVPAECRGEFCETSLPMNGRVTALPAALIAQALRLGGGSYTLDAACASSLYAIKLACDELAEGRADAMLAGGVSRPESLYTQMGFTQLRALARSGRCSPFDESSDGLIVGEGAGVVVLKRLDDALRDGDRIAGVIRGIGLSNDIGGSLLAPDSEGQLRAMRQAYAEAGWSPDAVDCIECHGTGTPIGDAVEVVSLRTLWEGVSSRPGQCAIGSVKSMIGHLLTAAGAAGFIKTLLAMRHATLAPSANFSRAARVIPLEGSPFRVQTAAEPWNVREESTPRRAAISAFGFGGINAHVLVEEWRKCDALALTKVRITAPVMDESVAIVGMDARFGTVSGLDAFRDAVMNGRTAFRERPGDRWNGCDAMTESQGAFLTDVTIPVGKYRIPPNEIPTALPQQLVVLESVAAALTDAGMPLRSRRPRVGVIIGMSLDFDTTNYHLRWWLEGQARRWAEAFGLQLSDDELNRWIAELKEASGPALDAPRVLGALGGMIASRIARECQLGGPSFAVSCEEASGLKALEIAARAVRRGELDAAIVSAVDMAGDVRAVMSLADDGVRCVGEGAATVVLKRLSDAKCDGDRVYAVLDGFGSATQDDSRAAMQRAGADAEMPYEVADLLEWCGTTERIDPGNFDLDLRRGEPIALSVLSGTIGHVGAASGLAAVVKSALCLYHSVLPPTPESEMSAGLRVRLCDVFHSPRRAMSWLRNKEDGPRRAGVHAVTRDGNAMHVLLAQSSSALVPTSCVDRPLALFALTGARIEGLIRSLDELDLHLLKPFDSMDHAARSWFARHAVSNTDSVATAFVASDLNEARTRVRQIRAHLQSHPNDALENVPGAYYTPHPLGREEGIAFVYPGAGNHFVGMGSELAVQFPNVVNRLDAESTHYRDHLMPRWFAPYRMEWPDDWRDTSEKSLAADMRRTIFGQVAYGVLATDVLRSLGVAPDAVIGYSLGESAGLFAMRAWPERDEMHRRMFSSPLFATDLAGPRNALRESWGLPPDAPVDWHVVLIPRTPNEVRDALADAPHARLLIVNTPKECVVGGLLCDVEQVVAKLRCRAIPLDGVPTVHCDALRSVESAYREFHLMRTTPPGVVRFYSSASAMCYNVTRESAAESILQHARHGFSFPDVIEQAYADGVRVFVEVGPQASCTRMIRRILDGKEHAAQSLSMRGESEYTTLLKLAGQLIGHRVPLDLAALYARQDVKTVDATHEEAVQVIRVPVGWRMSNMRLPAIRRNNESAMRMPVVTSVHLESCPAPALVGVCAETGVAAAHEAFLRFSRTATEGLTSLLTVQAELIGAAMGSSESLAELLTARVPTHVENDLSKSVPVAFDRTACLEFARGKVANVLGPEFAIVDTYAARVRLPDEPLMLVDRILTVEGEKASLTHGRLVTEHDVLPGAWYLDGDRCPICITVEAGQADLFLSGYLGIDFVAKGERTYRLLDATVQFHRGLPRPGETIRYDICIDRFVRQGGTYLFFFEFDGSIDGSLVLTMRNGCAGFFTKQEIAYSHGIVLSTDELAEQTGTTTAGFAWPCLAMKPNDSIESSYDDARLSALRQGDISTCFGPAFANLGLKNPLRLPGGRMKLIDRVLELDPHGGRYGLGKVVAEADVKPDDWYLTCHFVDDMVMPGTLMYECCAHALRFFLMRMGWIAEADGVAFEPIPGVSSGLRCRGPVTPRTKKVTYQIEIKEAGYRPEPYVLADALMSADGRPIVQMKNMSLQMTGLNRETIEALWANVGSAVRTTNASEPLVRTADPTPAFSGDQILAFAVGNPSDCFGEPYRVFDRQRRIARLPGPPYQFLDRVLAVRQPAFVLAAGDWMDAEYDVPPDAWYFEANRQSTMPFAVLLEIALQPCGFLAAYCGSALTSDTDLSFRNLGGTATLHEELGSDCGTLHTRVRVTSVSRAGGMIIEKFDMQVLRGERIVYEGDTSFGFFSATALAQQIGVRDAVQRLWQPSSDQVSAGKSFALPDLPPHTPDDVTQQLNKDSVAALPARAFRMVDRVDSLLSDGGPHGLGFISGSIHVNPGAWFFKAHFYQDPVWPGSLGLEAFLQLLKAYALERWPHLATTHRFEAITVGVPHTWVYRGQVIPSNKRVEVQAVISRRDDGPSPMLLANGFLSVDGVIIYEMTDFGLRMVPVHD
ncbi:MAG: beta-ketoacyl synthase N-terminal-like domain-containing protein [Planctomycetota bacterium]